VVIDGHALAHVVGAVAADLPSRPLSRPISRTMFSLPEGVVELRLHVGEPFTRLMIWAASLPRPRLGSRAGDLCGPLLALRARPMAPSRRQRIRGRYEGEALGLFLEKHGGQVAVADATLRSSAPSQGAEGLHAFAQGTGDVHGLLLTLLEAMAAPEMYAQQTFSETDGLNSFRSCNVHALASVSFSSVSREAIPYWPALG